MVLESILNPKNAKQNPIHIFVISIIYSLVAIVISSALFPQQSSILSIAVITFLFIPFFQRLFEVDEKYEDLAALKKLNSSLFTRHGETMKAFSAFFMGTMVAVSFAYIFLPSYTEAFSLQTDTLNRFATGNVTLDGNIMKFLLNNTQVMMLVFILSAAFGAGSLLVLAWNASVIGVYLGLIVRSVTNTGIDPAFAFAYGVPLGIFSIALHGIPEIYAYFLAGLAGGILSVGLIRERVGSLEFNNLLMDSAKLLIAAEVLIIFAAWLEVTF